MSGYVGADADYRPGTDDPPQGQDIIAGLGLSQEAAGVIAKGKVILELIGTGATYIIPAATRPPTLRIASGNPGSTYKVDLGDMV